MRMSQLLGARFKERPADAVFDSHAFLLRGGYLRQVTNGVFSLLPPGQRVLHKLQAIVREEMERAGAQEILSSIARPSDWAIEANTGGRIEFDDRSGRAMSLGGLCEEAVVQLCRGELRSYSQLPFAVFQIQTEFRDEPRSRGALIQAREFMLQETYSFHTSQECLATAYEAWTDNYRRIFARTGLAGVVLAEAVPRPLCGELAHAFMLPCDAGGETLVACDSCSYRATLDAASGSVTPFPEAPKPLEKVHTPGLKTIRDVAAYVGVEPRQGAKAVLYDSDRDGRLVILVIRGDIEASEAKVARIIGKTPVPASEERILACGAVPGFATAMGLDPAKCRIIIDHTIAESGNFVCGANEIDWHYKNFNLERDLPGICTVDVAQLPDGARCAQCGGVLRYQDGLTLAALRDLGTRYTQSMDMSYMDEAGKARYPVVARFAMGLSRLLSAVVEARHDKFGPKWPMTLAPWQVHLHALKAHEDGVRSAADTLYSELQAAGIEVLYDDRDVSPGVQFAEADLLGAPIRILVGSRHLASGHVEYKRRDTGENGTLSLTDAVAAVRQWIDDAMRR